MRRKKSRNALLGSLFLMLLCFAMLLGTTFAWFTENVSANVSSIRSGNMKIRLQYAVQPESGGTLIWKDATARGEGEFFSGSALWEPGYTGIVYFRVVNEGNLDVKFRYNVEVVHNALGTNRNGESIDLTDYLQLYSQVSGQKATTENCPAVVTQSFLNTVFGESTSTIANANSGLQQGPEGLGKSGIVYTNGGGSNMTIPAGEVSNVICLAIRMPDTVGNAANPVSADKIPEIRFRVNVQAGQAAGEYDSFGNQYDANASYTAPTTQPESNEEG